MAGDAFCHQYSAIADADDIGLQPHPFPFFHNQGKGMLFELADTNKKLVHGVILLPENLARFVKLPGDNLRFVLVEAVIKACIGKIYTKHVLKSSTVFSIIRDSEIEIDDEANDLINEFETALRARKRGSVVLLTLNSDASASTLNLLCQAMAIEKIDVLVRMDRCRSTILPS